MTDTYNKDISPQLRHYRKKIAIDEEFYRSEVKRSTEYIKNRYKYDPEFRNRMISNAKARYAKMKLNKSTQISS